MNKHKWWHFIFGEEIAKEVIDIFGSRRTENVWYACKICKKQLSKKWGQTSFHMGTWVATNKQDE